MSNLTGLDRYFNDRFVGLLPRRKYTESFRKDVVKQHHLGIAGSAFREWRGVSDSTMGRWYRDLIYLKNQEFEGRPYPVYLGIDEHFFSMKLGFSNSLIDLCGNFVGIKFSIFYLENRPQRSSLF